MSVRGTRITPSPYWPHREVYSKAMSDYIITITATMHPFCLDREFAIAQICDFLDQALLAHTVTGPLASFRLTCEGVKDASQNSESS